MSSYIKLKVLICQMKVASFSWLLVLSQAVVTKQCLGTMFDFALIHSMSSSFNQLYIIIKGAYNIIMFQLNELNS